MRLLFAAFLLLPTAAMAEGMPQLDFANPLTISQVVWGGIIFALLYFLAKQFALPKVAEVLEERALHIARDLESAQAAKSKADTAVEELTQATGKARSEAQAAINAAVERAKAAAAQQTAELNARLERQLAESEAQIAAARTAAMGALREVAIDTATTMVFRLTGNAPSNLRLRRAIDQALTARGIG